MSDAAVIKEFLVSLGFKVDEAGAKKFKTGLSDTTKSALAMGGAIVGAGMAVEKFIEAMTEGLSKLYYMSERTGASVGGLKSTAAGFEAIGLSADKANESIEAVGDLLNQPWTKNFLKSWGIDPELSKTRHTEDVVNDIKHEIAKKYNASEEGGGERNLAYIMAEKMLHLNARDTRTMIQNLPAADAMQADIKKKQQESGTDFDKQAKAAAEFQRELVKLGATFGVLTSMLDKDGTRIQAYTRILDDFGEVLRSLIKGTFWHDTKAAIKDTRNSDARTGFGGLIDQYMYGMKPASEHETGGASGTWGDGATPTPAAAGAGGEWASGKAAPFAWNGQMHNGDGYAKGSLAKSQEGQSQILSQELSDARDSLNRPGLSQDDIERINANISSLMREFKMAHLTPPGGATAAGGASGGDRTLNNSPTYNINVSGQNAQDTATSVKTVVRQSNDELTRNAGTTLSY